MASILNVNSIQPFTDDTAVSLTYGAVVSSGYALTCSGGINVGGSLTATSFAGNGSALTNLPVATIGSVVSLFIIS